jgi:hypothetical protein
VYEALLGGERAAAKKPVLSTAEDLDKFHYQLQLLWSVPFSPIRSTYDGKLLLIHSLVLES